jgi:5'-nucleotidase
MVGASPLISGLFHDEPTIDALNKLDLDVTSVGNHEFDEGAKELGRLQNGGCHPTDGCYDAHKKFRGADFPYLAANVTDEKSGKPILAPYWVWKKNGIKVGFIGVTLEGTPDIVSAEGVKGLKFGDEVETINKYAKVLQRQGVQSIVALVHEGGAPASGSYNYDCDSPGAGDGISGPIVDIAKHVTPAVDALVTGHTHQAYVCTIDDPAGRPRMVTSASSFGRLYTDTTLTYDRRTGDIARTAVTSANHVVTRDVAKAPDMTDLITKWKTLAAPISSRPIGYIAGEIGNSGTESPMGDLIADAQLAYAKSLDPEADLALMNPGGIRASLTYASSGGEGDGVVTYGEAYTVQPFSNTVNLVDLTGAQVITALQQQVSGANEASPKILQVSNGLTYTLDLTKSGAARVVVDSVRLGGTAIDPAATYRVAMNSFLAGGGDGFAELGKGANVLVGGDDLAAFEGYLTANSSASAPHPVRTAACASREFVSAGLQLRRRRARQPYRRHRATALRRCQGHLAAHLLDRTGHDRQAEARAGQRPGARGTPEAVEHVREFLRGDAGSVVADRQHTVRQHDLDRAALGAELHRVVQDVHHGTLQRGRLRPYVPRLEVRHDRQLRAAQPRPFQRGLDDVLPLHGLRPARVLALLRPRQFLQIADERGQFGHLRLHRGEQRLAVLRRDRAARLLTAGEEFDVGAQRRERRPQFMSGVRDQLLLQFAGVGQGRGHRVEGAGEPGDLVLTVRVHGDADGQILGTGDVLDRLGQLVDGTQARARHGQPDRPGAHHSHAGDEEQQQGQVVEGVLGALERHGDEESGVREQPGLAADATRADHQGQGQHPYVGAFRVRAVAKDPLVAAGVLDHVLVGVGDLDHAGGVGGEAGCPVGLDQLDVEVVADPEVVAVRPRALRTGGQCAQYVGVPLRFGRRLLQVVVHLLVQLALHDEPAAHRYRRHPERHGRRHQQGQPGTERKGPEPLDHSAPPCRRT